MSQELFYTSARRGLKPGSQGFCTVAQTRNLSAALAERLEALSSYRPALPPHDSQADLNPIVQAHYRLTVGGLPIEVLSYVCPAGLDYTQRNNKFAHHVVLDDEELPAGGPAWLLQQPGFMARHWEGEPRVLAAGRRPPRGDTPPAACRRWAQVTGDAGWAGVLAEAFLADSSRVAYLQFELGLDPLPLLAEAIGLLPFERRWEVTFSTYHTGLPPGVRCAWRCVLADSPETAEAARLPGALRINLSTSEGPAPDSDLARQARSGQRPTGQRPAAQRPAARVRVPAGRAAASLPLRRPRVEPVGIVREIPVETDASDHVDGAPPLPPPNPPPPPRRPAPPRGRRFPSLILGLLLGLPLAAGTFALGRFLPRQEAPPPPANDRIPQPFEGDNLRGELQVLEVEATKRKDCVKQVAQSLETAHLPGLAEILRDQEEKLKVCEQQVGDLRNKLETAKNDANGLSNSHQAELRKVKGDLEFSKKQFQTAQRIVLLRHHLLTRIANDRRSPLLEQNLEKLLALNERLDKLAKKLEGPNADPAQVDTEVGRAEKDIKDLIKAITEVPPMPPPSGGDMNKAKELLEQAKAKVKEYEDLKKRDKEKAKKAREKASSLLDKLAEVKGADDKTINALRQQLK